MVKEGNIYFYMGRHKIRALQISNQFVIIEHIEKGYIGSKRKGYTKIKIGEISTTHRNNCYEDKLNSNKNIDINQIEAEFKGWTNNTILNEVLKNIDLKDRKIIIKQYNQILKQVLIQKREDGAEDPLIS